MAKPDTVIPTLVIGGDPSQVKVGIAEALRKFSHTGRRIDPRWLWGYENSINDRFPASCELVIVLTDLINHGRHDSAIKQAQKHSDAKVILTTRRYVEYKASLEKSGFRENLEAPPMQAEEQKKAFRKKRGIVRRIVLENPLLSGKDVADLCIPAFKQRLEGKDRDLAGVDTIDPHIIREIRSAAGIFRGVGGSPAHVVVDLYNAACLEAGITPRPIPKENVISYEHAKERYGSMVPAPPARFLNAPPASVLPEPASSAPVAAAPTVVPPPVTPPEPAPVATPAALPAALRTPLDELRAAATIFAEAARAADFTGTVSLDLDTGRITGKRKKLVIVEEDAEIA